MAEKNLQSNAVDLQRYLENKEITLNRKTAVEAMNKTISHAYKYDIRSYVAFCEEQHQQQGVESMIDYMYLLVVKDHVKKSTFEKKLQAIKKHLSVNFEIVFEDNVYFNEQIKGIRRLFNEHEYAEQNILEGKSPLQYEEIMKKIEPLDTRPKAICLVNYITGNRPNEMVSLKIRHFNFETNSIRIHLKKQSDTVDKVMTKEVAEAVKAYIAEFGLKEDDYFVGQVNRYGKYVSKQITVRAYWDLLKRYTNLSGYNFRKSIIKRMHDNGADLPTIAKQTGHKKIDTITDHYLNVDTSRVKKFIE